MWAAAPVVAASAVATLISTASRRVLHSSAEITLNTSRGRLGLAADLLAFERGTCVRRNPAFVFFRRLRRLVRSLLIGSRLSSHFDFSSLGIAVRFFGFFFGEIFRRFVGVCKSVFVPAVFFVLLVFGANRFFELGFRDLFGKRNCLFLG